MNKYKTIKYRVESLLLSHVHLRDDVKGVIAEILIEDGLTLEQAKIVAKYYKKADTINRRWRRTQQLYPRLRGITWSSRQGKQEDVQKDLGYNVNK